MRILRLSSAVALSFAALIATGCAEQSARSCVAPEATASPTNVASGQTVTVNGRYWGPCNDTNHSSDPPWDLVSVEWRGPGGTVFLGDIAIDDGTFSGSVEVPVTAEPGASALWVGAREQMVEIPMAFAEGAR
ncbi:hypothetical protein [Microbacterium maritypicum]